MNNFGPVGCSPFLPLRHFGIFPSPDSEGVAVCFEGSEEPDFIEEELAHLFPDEMEILRQLSHLEKLRLHESCSDKDVSFKNLLLLLIENTTAPSRGLVVGQLVKKYAGKIKGDDVLTSSLVEYVKRVLPDCTLLDAALSTDVFSDNQALALKLKAAETCVKIGGDVPAARLAGMAEEICEWVEKKTYLLENPLQNMTTFILGASKLLEDLFPREGLVLLQSAVKAGVLEAKSPDAFGACLSYLQRRSDDPAVEILRWKTLDCLSKKELAPEQHEALKSILESSGKVIYPHRLLDCHEVNGSVSEHFSLELESVLRRRIIQDFLDEGAVAGVLPNIVRLAQLGGKEELVADFFKKQLSLLLAREWGQPEVAIVKEVFKLYSAECPLIRVDRGACIALLQKGTNAAFCPQDLLNAGVDSLLKGDLEKITDKEILVCYNALMKIGASKNWSVQKKVVQRLLDYNLPRQALDLLALAKNPKISEFSLCASAIFRCFVEDGTPFGVCGSRLYEKINNKNLDSAAKQEITILMLSDALKQGNVAEFRYWSHKHAGISYELPKESLNALTLSLKACLLTGNMNSHEWIQMVALYLTSSNRSFMGQQDIYPVVGAVAERLLEQKTFLPAFRLMVLYKVRRESFWNTLLEAATKGDLGGEAREVYSSFRQVCANMAAPEWAGCWACILQLFGNEANLSKKIVLFKPEGPCMQSIFSNEMRASRFPIVLESFTKLLEEAAVLPPGQRNKYQPALQTALIHLAPFNISFGSKDVAARWEKLMEELPPPGSLQAKYNVCVAKQPRDWKSSDWKLLEELIYWPLRNVDIDFYANKILPLIDAIEVCELAKEDDVWNIVDYLSIHWTITADRTVQKILGRLIRKYPVDKKNGTRKSDIQLRLETLIKNSDEKRVEEFLSFLNEEDVKRYFGQRIGGLKETAARQKLNFMRRALCKKGGSFEQKYQDFCQLLKFIQEVPSLKRPLVEIPKIDTAFPSGSIGEKEKAQLLLSFLTALIQWSKNENVGLNVKEKISQLLEMQPRVIATYSKEEYAEYHQKLADVLVAFAPAMTTTDLRAWMQQWIVAGFHVEFADGSVRKKWAEVLAIKKIKSSYSKCRHKKLPLRLCVDVDNVQASADHLPKVKLELAALGEQLLAQGESGVAYYKRFPAAVRTQMGLPIEIGS